MVQKIEKIGLFSLDNVEENIKFKKNLSKSNTKKTNDKIVKADETSSVEFEPDESTTELKTKSAKKNSNSKIPDIDYNSKDWEAIKPNKDTFLGFEQGTYTYRSKNGTSITLKANDNVIIKENKKTGEVVIVGAVDGKIRSENNNSSIYIIDSKIDSVTTANGDDSVYLMDSEVKNSIQTGNGDDKVFVSNSKVDKIDSLNGEDEIIVQNNSDIKYVNTGDGADKVTVENSNIDNTLKTGNNTDSVVISNSTIKNIYSEDGTDNILIQNNSEIEKLDTGNDQNTVDVLNSSILNLNIKKGENNVYSMNSQIENIQGEGENNNIIQEDSSIEDYFNNISDIDISKLDSTSTDISLHVLDSISSEYKKQELTEEEKTQALVIDFFDNNASSIKEQFKHQEDEGGLVADSYNLIKQLTDLGIAKDDIQKAINEQEEMISELKASLNGKSDESFEDCFKKWTGVEYDQENMTKFMDTYQNYKLAVTGLNKSAIFEEKVKEASNLAEVLNCYSEYYGSREKGIEELNKDLDNAYKNREGITDIQQVHIDENENLIYDSLGEVESISNVLNMFQTNPREFPIDKQGEFAEKFEKKMGISIADLQKQYIAAELKTTGHANSFQNLIDEYCQDNNSLTDRISGIVSTGGMLTIAGGAVICVTCPPATGLGIAVMQAGQTAAVSGMFLDEGLDYVDEITSGNASKEDLEDIVKETLTDLALFYSGRAINAVSGNVHEKAESYIMSKLASMNSKEAAKYISKLGGALAEIGVDAPMSLCADYIITGEVDLTGEGISQLMAIVTGISGSKINQYKTEIFENAQRIALDGDIKAAEQYLNEKGMSKKDIKAAILPIEYENAYKIYQETGKIDSINEYAKNSSILTEIDKDSLIAKAQLDALEKTGYDLKQIGMENKGFHDFTSPQGKMLAQDIDLIYKSATTGIPIEDIMVPKIKTPDASLTDTNIKIGDLFEAEGSNNVYIRTSEGYQELDISKETYCRLFPAVERWSAGQQCAADCYLVSALNSMLSNPHSRAKLLSRISEDPDTGAVTVTVGEGAQATKVVLEQGQTMADLNIDPNKQVDHCLGVQFLEYAYKVNLYTNSFRDLAHDFDASASSRLDIIDNSLKRSYDENTDYYKTQNINSFDEFLSKMTEENNIAKQKAENIIGKKLSYDQWIKLIYCPTPENPIVKELQLDSNTQNKFLNSISEIDKLKLYPYAGICERYQIVENAEKWENHEFADEIIQIGEYGHSSNVYSAFGLSDVKFEKIHSENNAVTYKKILENPDLQSDYVITAATIMTKEAAKQRYDDVNCDEYKEWHDNPEVWEEYYNNLPDGNENLIGCHAYSINFIKNENGEIMVEVVNPWSTSYAKDNKSIILTLEEFEANFNQVYISKVN